MTLVKISEAGQITLPESARDKFRLGEGDYLDAEIMDDGIMLKPVHASAREEAWNELMEIIDRPKWRGPGPEPSEEELMAEIVQEIKAMRRERRDAESRSR